MGVGKCNDIQNQKDMNLNWFVRRGIFYQPITVVGWVILAGMVAYVVYAFVVIDQRSHSVSDTLMNWVFQCLLTGFVYSAIGFLAAKRAR